MRRRAFLALVVAAVVGGAAGLAANPERLLPTKPIDAKLKSPDGEKIRLSDFRGQPLLLELWATWCQPCREQARIVADLEGELTERHVAVLAVNQGEKDDVVEKFLADHPSHAPVALDRYQEISAKLAVGELPAIAVLDEQGNVVGVRLGLTSSNEILAMLDETGTAHPPAP